MEESFNRAANRGKFKQSSEGSGGKSPKEKQDNLRNTLGNIMREKNKYSVPISLWLVVNR